jgi:hypothetical protein
MILSSFLALSEAIKADHGFNVESRAIRDLIEIMSEYDAPSRRDYLQFITGSPKLPIGGKLLPLFVKAYRDINIFPFRLSWSQPTSHGCTEAS